MRQTLIFFFFLLLAASSQAQDLTGNWRLDFPNTLSLMEGAQKSRYDSLPSQAKQRAAAAMEGREFGFSSGNTVVIKWKTPAGDRESSGTYAVNNDQIILSIEGAVYRYVYQVTGTQLILRNTEPQGIFAVLSFNKMN